MKFPRYSVKAMLWLMLLVGVSTWVVVKLVRAWRVDDIARIKRNGYISPLTRTFLLDHANNIDDQQLRSFLGLTTSAWDDSGREFIGGETRVELVMALTLQHGSVWFVRDHCEACFSERTFAAILTDDSGRVKDWTLLEGLPGIDSCTRSLDGMVAEKFLLTSESPIGDSSMTLVVSLDGELALHPEKLPPLADRIDWEKFFENLKTRREE